MLKPEKPAVAFDEISQTIRATNLKRPITWHLTQRHQQPGKPHHMIAMHMGNVDALQLAN